MDNKTKIKTEILSLIVTAILAFSKLFVGFLINSVSIISQGIDSLTDLIAATITLYAVTKSDDPPDQKYNYGYGQYENLAGMFVSLFIFSAGITIIYESINKLIYQTGFTTNINIGIRIMVFAAFVNLFLYLIIYYVSKKTDSAALQADARHKITDVINTLAVLIGLVLIYFTHWNIIDPIIGIVVSVVIMWNGFFIFKENILVLLDIAIPEKDLNIVKKILNEYIRQYNSEGKYLNYHSLRTRKAGNDYFIDLHLESDEIDLNKIHDLSDDIETALRGVFDNDVSVIIHQEPKINVN